MRNIKYLLILTLLWGCNKSKITETLWVADNYIGCPYVLKFTEDLMWANITSGSFFEAFQYKIVDDKLILNLISDNVFNVPMPDTLDIFFVGDKLTIDTFTYTRIENELNFYQSVLSKRYHGFELPSLDYKLKIDRCASNSIVIPKQHPDSLEFYINGHKLNAHSIGELTNYLNEEDLNYRNMVRFFVDGSVNHKTLNLIRRELRLAGLLYQDFIYAPAEKDLFNLFDVYGISLKTMRRSEKEQKEYEQKYYSDTSSLRKAPLPPPPPPFLRNTPIDSKITSIKVNTGNL